MTKQIEVISVTHQRYLIVNNMLDDAKFQHIYCPFCHSMFNIICSQLTLKLNLLSGNIYECNVCHTQAVVCNNIITTEQYIQQKYSKRLATQIMLYYGSSKLITRHIIAKILKISNF